MTLELHATPEEVMRAVESLQQFGQARQIPEKTLFGLSLALEECGSNIVNHALRGDEQQTFRVTFNHTERALVIELRDNGPEFDPTQVAMREETTHDDNRTPGGWGIQLVRRYTDEICYMRDGSENVLRLTKGLDGPTGQKRPC